MNTPPRLFIYEVRQRTGPVTHDFHSYIIYSSQNHQIIQQFKDDSMRRARRKCDTYIDEKLSDEDLSILVWRNWPLLMWSDELTEQKIIEKIRKREVLS